MECVEDTRFTTEYHAPDKRYIGNALQITLNDGTVLEEVEIDYPIGHRKRREEGTPVLLQKFERHLRGRFPEEQVQAILAKSGKDVGELDIDEYVDLYIKK